jgi:hypothetical protein
MKVVFTLTRCALGAYPTVAMRAGCGGPQTSSSGSTAALGSRPLTWTHGPVPQASPHFSPRSPKRSGWLSAEAKEPGQSNGQSF